MRHLFSVVAAMVVVAAVMVAMATSALALQVEPLQPPPNCEQGQVQAWTSAWEYNKSEQRDDEQAEKHFLKFVDCANGQSPSEGGS